MSNAPRKTTDAAHKSCYKDFYVSEVYNSTLLKLVANPPSIRNHLPQDHKVAKQLRLPLTLLGPQFQMLKFYKRKVSFGEMRAKRRFLVIVPSTSFGANQILYQQNTSYKLPSSMDES